jgi:uncharacterized protein (TIGR00725 family)
LVGKARKIIAVFGSSRSIEGEAEYAAAYEQGKLLAEAGFDVCSGGYSGAMEAVSRGAREAGGRTIGVTVQVINRSGNQWLDEEVRTDSIFQRIEHMLTVSDGCIALRGGSGTLAEIAMTLNLLLLGALEPRPLVLVGPDWQAVMNTFFEHMPSNEYERQLLAMAGSPAEAVRLLVEKLS